MIETEMLRPNGPECEPTCSLGKAQVTLESASE